ncbi:17369_t:CDS:2, partial [Funneliformis caledonium]
DEASTSHQNNYVTTLITLNISEILYTTTKKTLLKKRNSFQSLLMILIIIETFLLTEMLVIEKAEIVNTLEEDVFSNSKDENTLSIYY